VGEQHRTRLIGVTGENSKRIDNTITVPRSPSIGESVAISPDRRFDVKLLATGYFRFGHFTNSVVGSVRIFRSKVSVGGDARHRFRVTIGNRDQSEVIALSAGVPRRFHKSASDYGSSAQTEQTGNIKERVTTEVKIGVS